MTMEQQIACDQLRYKKPISITNQFLDFVMNMRAQSRINVAPNWPQGWRAQVAAEDKVWTIECERGELQLVKVGDFMGVRPNGALIIGAEEKIDEYQRYFIAENYYGGMDILPLTCENFCNQEEARCIHCPFGKR